MITKKYKNIYEKFIEEYKRIHINPWHEITEEELNKITNDLITKMNIEDNSSFTYFMNYIIKKISGTEDAHTKILKEIPLPINFKIFNSRVYINYPKEIKGSKLISINGIKINQIIKELEEVITYGTEGKRRYEIEKSLFNSIKLFGLPSLKESETLTYQILTIDGQEITKTFKKDEEYPEELFDYDEYLYGETGAFTIDNDTLIYKHTSVQPKFKEKIEHSIANLRKIDLSNITKIIIDLRGNTGGNSALNKPLMDFLSENSDKELITLIDYRVFSGGRYALRDLLNLGTITIGEEISTPINCYGNSKLVLIDNCNFSISECYYDPFNYISIKSKEEFFSQMNNELLKPNIYKPDIYVEYNEEDFINGIDPVLEYAKNLNNKIEGRKI